MFLKKIRSILSIVLFSSLLIMSYVPTYAIGNMTSNKISSGLTKLLDSTPGNTVIKITVFFVDSPTYEKDIKTETKELFKAYYEGTLDKTLITDDFDPEYEIPRLAKANVISHTNKEYIDKLDGLIENVEFVSMYAPYVCFALQASKVTALAKLDFVQSVSEYEDTVCFDEDSNADKQNAFSNKIATGLFIALDSNPDESVIKVTVLFANPATYENDVETATAELFKAYYEGTLDKTLITDDFDPEYEIPRLAKANVISQINKEYIDQVDGLIENVEFVGKYAPYVCFSLKASEVTFLANLEYVRAISEYEEIVSPDEEPSSDERFFIEDPSRFEEKNTEGYPLDLSFDGTYWIHSEGWRNGDIDRDGRVTAADARLALRASVNLWEPFICEQFYAADIDGNNRITPSDARSILRASVGLF